MSYDFHSERTIKAIRKAHVCEQCGRKIQIGEPASYGAGSYEGDFYTTYTHVECNTAARDYANHFGCWGEEYPWFQHSEEPQSDGAWLREHHPIVADRLGWALPEAEAAE